MRLEPKGCSASRLLVGMLVPPMGKSGLGSKIFKDIGYWRPPTTFWHHIGTLPDQPHHMWGYKMLKSSKDVTSVWTLSWLHEVKGQVFVPHSYQFGTPSPIQGILRASQWQGQQANPNCHPRSRSWTAGDWNSSQSSWHANSTLQGKMIVFWDVVSWNHKSQVSFV